MPVKKRPSHLDVVCDVAAAKRRRVVTDPKFAAGVEALAHATFGGDHFERRGRAEAELVESVIGVHENRVARATGLDDSAPSSRGAAAGRRR